MPVKRVCLICNKIFFVFPVLIRRGWGKYCSRHCRDLSFKERYRPRSDVLTITLRKGEKDGFKNFIKMTDDRGGCYNQSCYDWFVFAHMIWMNHNGPIPKGYVIHHKDYDKTNDTIENLVCLSNSEHSSMHMKLGHRISRARKRNARK